MATRLGLSLPQMKQYDIGRDIPAVARAAEEIGYESLWVFERILFPEPARQGLYGVPGLPWPDQYRSVADPLVTLTLAAAVTERARLGTSVLVAPLHVPFQLARALASLDAASGGRVVAGIGTGWSYDEYAAASVAPFEKRGQVLDELLDVCRAVWGPDPVTYEGELTTIAPAVVAAEARRADPGAAAGEQPEGRCAGSSTVRTAGCRWPRAPSSSPSSGGGLQELAEERGRKEPIQSVLRVNTSYTRDAYKGDDRRPFQGSVAQIVEDLVAHDAVGLEEILIDLQGRVRDADELTDVAAEVFTAAREAGV